MSATVVVRSTGVEGYGRHAAPPSAYGPSDIHRLLPVSPAGSGAERVDGGDAPVETVDSAVPSESAAAVAVGAGDQPSAEVPATATGFWTRLRLLPRAA